MHYTAAMMAYSLLRALAAYRDQCDILRVVVALGSATTSDVHEAMFQRRGLSRTATQRHLTRLRQAGALVAHPMRGETDNQGVVWAVPGVAPKTRQRVWRSSQRVGEAKEAGSWWVSRPRDGFTQAARTRWS